LFSSLNKVQVTLTAIHGPSLHVSWEETGKRTSRKDVLHSLGNFTMKLVLLKTQNTASGISIALGKLWEKPVLKRKLRF